MPATTQITHTLPEKGYKQICTRLQKKSERNTNNTNTPINSITQTNTK